MTSPPSCWIMLALASVVRSTSKKQQIDLSLAMVVAATVVVVLLRQTFPPSDSICSMCEECVSVCCCWLHSRSTLAWKLICIRFCSLWSLCLSVSLSLRLHHLPVQRLRSTEGIWGRRHRLARFMNQRCGEGSLGGTSLCLWRDTSMWRSSGTMMPGSGSGTGGWWMSPCSAKSIVQ